MIETIRYIVLRDEEGLIINMWETTKAAAEALDVTTQTILNNIPSEKRRNVRRSRKIPGKLSEEYMTIHTPTPEELFENLDGEEWRLCPSFPDHEISNYGRLRKGFKLKNISPTGIGYCSTCIVKDGKQYSVYIHRLVAEAFLPTWDPALVVNHKDENKSNNHVSNLEMMTQSENVRYSYELHKDTWGPRKNKQAS